MIVKLQIPKLDANIEEVTVTAWLKKEGEPVAKGEGVCEITTDKASIEMESPHSGVLRKVLARAKSTVPVGYVLALIGDPRDPLPDVTGLNRRLMDARRDRLARRPAGAVAPAPDAVRVRATPAARRLARERGVDLAAVAAARRVEVVRESDLREYMESLR